MEIIRKLVELFTKVNAKQVKEMMRTNTTVKVDDKPAEYFQKIADEINAMKHEKK